MNIDQLSLFAVAGVLFAMVLKKERPEYGIVLSMVVCVCIFFSVVGRLSILLESVNRLRELATMDGNHCIVQIKSAIHKPQSLSERCSCFASFNSRICNNPNNNATIGSNAIQFFCNGFEFFKIPLFDIAVVCAKIIIRRRCYRQIDRSIWNVIHQFKAITMP